MKILTCMFALFFLTFSGCSKPINGDSAATYDDADTHTGAITDTGAATDPDTGTNTKPNTDTNTKPSTDTNIQPITNTDTKPSTDTNIQPITNTDIKPSTDTDIQPNTNTDTKPSTDTDTDTSTDTDVNTAPTGCATDPCDENAECTDDTGDNYVCSCKEGFDGDGYTCEDIDECQNGDSQKCPVGSTCVNTPGSHSCWCGVGFIYDSAAGRCEKVAAVPSVSTSGIHACSLDGDGKVICWGDNWWDEAMAPLEPFRQIQTVPGHTCGLRDNGRLDCWGEENLLQRDIPQGTYTEIALGLAHACALTTDGTPVCWGRDHSGHLLNTPLSEPLPGPFTQLTADHAHTCGIRADDHTIQCWGTTEKCVPWESDTGTLGYDCHDVGIFSPPEGAFAQIAAGYYYGCGLNGDGKAVCWGTEPTTPVPPPDELFVQITADCGLRPDGTVYCWSPSIVDKTPYRFKKISTRDSVLCGVQMDDTVRCTGGTRSVGDWPGGRYKAIAMEDSTFCGVLADGPIRCWGARDYSQVQFKFTADGSFKALDVGAALFCAIDAQSELFCQGEIDITNLPSGPISQIVCGDNQCCALTPTNKIHCFGDHYPGETRTPNKPFVQVAVGRYFACGVGVDQTMVCWGEAPHTIEAPSGAFLQVTLGQLHGCGLKTDQTLHCWGTTPPTGTFTQVSAGPSHVCAVATDGTIACWGDIAHNPPAYTDFVQVASYWQTSCGLRADGTLACWGKTVR